MFVKESWNTKVKNPKKYYHVAESYRDPETKTPKHRLIANISDLPQHVIEAIKIALDGEQVVDAHRVSISFGDTYTGAGLLAIYRMWKKLDLDRALSGLSPAKRDSVFLMVAQRILQPGSKLALKESLEDTIFSLIWSKGRFDEDELYETMDALHDEFYEIQQKLQAEDTPVLFLYDTTSTYFEGYKAADGDYGFSKDKRWDRHQIVIGLVCDENGIPQAVETWPGNTTDTETVGNAIERLAERFDVSKVIFVGDKGMYSEANIGELQDAQMDYILGLDWQKQRKQLLAQPQEQIGLFDEVGTIEWEENGTRYIGCASEARRIRDETRRDNGMKDTAEDLAELRRTAAKGKYYTQSRLRSKINEILEAKKVKDLWDVHIEPIDEVQHPEEKAKFSIAFQEDEQAIAERKSVEGKYVLETSIGRHRGAEQIREDYATLTNIERGFRHIKSYLKIRPVYHRLRRRIRAHVLICFIAYYIVKHMEIEFREKGETREVESVLRYWDKLRIAHAKIDAQSYHHEEWNWSMGEIGTSIQQEISDMGWWRSVQAYRRSLMKDIG